MSRHIYKQRDWALRRRAQRIAEFEAFLEENDEFSRDASDNGCDCPQCAPFLHQWTSQRKDAPS